MKIMAYDVETTGTNPGQHGIHQIAGIILIDGKEKERFEIKVRPNPKAKVDLEALKVANITLEEIMAYQPMEEGYRELLKILSKYVDKFNKQDKFFTLGYNNAGFDDNFLRGFFLQNGDQYYGSWFWADTMDVRVLAIRQLAPVRHTMEDFKLKTVARQVGITVDESKLHDAVYDVELTYEIFKRLRLTQGEINELFDEFKMQEAIELAYEQLESIEPVAGENDGNNNLESLMIAMNILKKFLKPVATALLFILLAFNPDDSFAQFRDKGPRGDALRYNSWLQKKYSYNGFKLNRGQRNALGLSNGFLGTGIGANRSKNKNKSKTKTTSHHETTHSITHPEPVYRLEHHARYGDIILYGNHPERPYLLREDRQYHIPAQRSTWLHRSSGKTRDGGYYDRAGWKILPHRLA